MRTRRRSYWLNRPCASPLLQVAAAEQQQQPKPGDRLSPAEMMELLSRLFEDADVDQSGALSLEEFKVRAGVGVASNMARVGGASGRLACTCANPAHKSARASPAPHPSMLRSRPHRANMFVIQPAPALTPSNLDGRRQPVLF